MDFGLAIAQRVERLKWQQRGERSQVGRVKLGSVRCQITLLAVKKVLLMSEHLCRKPLWPQIREFVALKRK